MEAPVRNPLRRARGRVSRTRPAAAWRHTPLVLVVEDYDDTRELYKQYLELSGYRVLEAADGLEALEKAATFLPDIILMDLALPRLDGWEVTRRLRDDPLTRGIPIVALTGHVVRSYLDGAYRAGVDACLLKPFPPDVLVTEIQELLNRRAAPAGRPR
ncbi:MAG: response regulator [Acidobacteria bacterium]|nr:response regulator [Acidobacteriota bacterium]